MFNKQNVIDAGALLEHINNSIHFLDVCSLTTLKMTRCDLILQSVKLETSPEKELIFAYINFLDYKIEN